ncbi:DUF3152 domain-containing protein [Streptomyces sp. WMMC500]|uniref:DUF3152 domain-containing protein n=1 Tax=Streptomyces sp. WMMC500 TaxID=3015154 RepID=UPI00248B39E3|nr:DUF3152 domain-containing protein [Streptomyces sp. WMMC500]WBB63266.1 DUF3152 domain-containing protein [Streptomyces sp. WMMC500]
MTDTGPVPRVPGGGPGPGTGRTVMGTGPMPRFGDTGPVPRVSGTGPIPRVSGTGSIPRVSGTGPVPRAGGTGPLPRVTDTGSMRPVGDTGAVPRVGDTGGMRRVTAPGAPPAHGMPRAPRGPRPPGTHAPMDDTGEHPLGHPEHREPGGGWGAPPYEQPGRGLGAATVAATPTPVRQDYLDAFDGPGPGRTAEPAARPGDVPGPAPAGDDRGRPPGDDGDGPPDEFAAALQSTGGGHRRPRRRAANRARVATGVAAAVVTCALAAAIAGQVSDGRAKRADAAAADARKQRDAADDAASRSGDRAGPAGKGGSAPDEDARAVPATYTEKMAATYPLSRNLTGSGKLTAVPGSDKAPGRGEVVAYRVDVEDGLPLDGELFASAVHKTLNDKRSWGGQGDRTFERVGPGEESVFVITLASPGTTDEWCAKSGLDTGDEDVSCDSAATERVMINAFRWAQGSKTYGDDIHAYRQMLINHEVGHRLGHGHVGCERDGALAPVMMQQTKYLSTDGATCRPNPWPFPRG